MASILTLTGARDSLGSGTASTPLPAGARNCECHYNPRTKKYAQLCEVPGTKSKSGKQFVKGGNNRCRR